MNALTDRLGDWWSNIIDKRVRTSFFDMHILYGLNKTPCLDNLAGLTDQYSVTVQREGSKQKPWYEKPGRAYRALD